METGRFSDAAIQLANGRVLVRAGVHLLFLSKFCGFEATGAAEIYPRAEDSPRK